MAGPHERSSDGSLDDILSSIRRIVADDLDGAERLKARFEDAQQAREAGSQPQQNGRPQTPQLTTPSASPPAQSAPVQSAPAQSVPALTRAATGTPATTFVEAELRHSQIEDTPPRDALAPFDRGNVSAVEPREAAPAVLDSPIVLPTEAEIAPLPTPAPTADSGAVDAHAANGHAPGPDGQPSNGTVADGPLPPVAPTPMPTEINAVTADAIAPVLPHPVNGTAHNPAADEPVMLPQAETSTPAEPLELGAAAADITAPTTPTPTTSTDTELNVDAVIEEPSPIVDPVVNEGAATGNASATSGKDAPAAPAGAGATSTTALEATVARLLRPMLKEWLDEHMPRLIEQALRDELSKPDSTQAPNA
ncbi:MAG: DUF2497 domain-containing protein [Pseudomonadota bacterium]